MANYPYPDDYKSALDAALAAGFAPLARTCNECGSELEREPHDAACIIGWLDTMPADYNDDTTDLSDRYNGKVE